MNSIWFSVRNKVIHACEICCNIVGYLLDSVIHSCGMLRDKSHGKAKCLRTFSLKSSNIPSTWMTLSC